MIVFERTEDVPAGFGPAVVTIGKFDGVHVGHREVITRVVNEARKRGLSSIAVTFDRHPLSLLAPEACPASLVSNEQKLELLAETGLDATLQLPFTGDVADLTPEEFVQHVLVEPLEARIVMVGDDFRFGRKGRGDVALLRELGAANGFEVLTVDDVMPTGKRRASSTWIRELLADGEVVAAARLLGHAPTVRGLVVHGAKRGRELGFPTANLSPQSQGLIPADGVYAGWLVANGEAYPAAVSVGNNPTFDGVPQRQVEAYVLDRDIDLYDQVVDIRFVERIRGMVAFSGIDPLIVQIRDDVERVRQILS